MSDTESHCPLPMESLANEDRLAGIQIRIDNLLDLYGSPQGSVAHFLCDAHPEDNIAFRFVDRDLTEREMTFGELRELSERFAAGLAQLGVKPGDRVATLMGKTADLVVAVLGIWRLGAVQVPLFTAFARPAIELRLTASRTRVLVCDSDQRAKIDAESSANFQVITCRSDDEQDRGVFRESDLDFAELLNSATLGFPTAALGGDAPMIHIFTSGTTGRPKGVVLPIRFLATTRAYMELGCAARHDGPGEPVRPRRRQKEARPTSPPEVAPRSVPRPRRHWLPPASTPLASLRAAKSGRLRRGFDPGGIQRQWLEVAAMRGPR